MQSYFDVKSGTLQAETAAFGMWPKMIGGGVMRVVNEHPINGISPHVHIVVCRSGQIFVMNNDTKTYGPGDTEIVEFKMPRVAHGYAEFLSMCTASGIAVEGAIG
jgi:hypothetical protein